jgi:hypothetical protein
MVGPNQLRAGVLTGNVISASRHHGFHSLTQFCRTVMLDHASRCSGSLRLALT